MTKKKEKKKTPSWFLYGLVVVMLAVFVFQMVFPTNLGKIFDKYSQNAVEIAVTVTAADGDNVSYHTDSNESMTAFSQWAHKQTMRNRSLADSVTAEAVSQTEYNFAIKAADGTYSAIVIDERGFVHVGAELYKVSGDVDSFIKEMISQFESWG
ncbi:MAG: hypothetical protein ACI4LP_09555 [Anaerovoracaceae bacterium]